MLCLACQNQPDCLVFRLSQVDVVIQDLLERLQHCDRHNPIGNPLPAGN
ncbi:MAG: hypothetical protein WCD18_21975 [Thermosynechococcaceae cyanobacterium]